MAKDILGREMAPGTSAAAYNAMATQGPPLLQTVGKGTRAVADTAGQALRNMGTLVNESPKLLGTPAAGIANLAASGGANFMTGFTGQKYVPNVYEGKSFTDMFGGVAPTTPAAAPAMTALPSITSPAPSTYVPGAGLPSAGQIASDKARATAAQSLSDQGMGAGGNIDVARQPNGVWSFTGKDIGPDAGVNYTGLPQWKSAQGGAGQGAVGQGFDLGAQNQRMASALQGIQAFDQQKQRADLINNIAGGAGGAVGVAQNKIALAGLGDMLDTGGRNAVALKAAEMQAETQKRAQDLGLTEAQGRNAATLAGYKLQAGTAKDEQALKRQELDLKAAIAEAGKSGDPQKVAQARLLNVEYMTRTGIDPVTGKAITASQLEQLQRNKILSGSNPYAVGAVVPGGMPE